MPAITATSLSRSFGETVAVDGLDLEVAEGELFGLVGPDGAGKTTTMRMLTGILAPSSGGATVAGYDVVKQAEPLKAHIGYMSQRFGLYPDLTVAENIDFYADIYGVHGPDRARRMEQLLAFSNLTPFQDRLAGKLSGGMKQKLGLACALIHTPRVLFLDEPTNGVDPVSRRDFWRILYQLIRDRVTIFVSTAYLDEAERCNRVALIHSGKLLAVGTPTEVKQLMRGSLLEIRTANPRQTAALLRQRLPNATVGLFGDRVHLATADPTKDETTVRDAIAAAGLAAPEIRPIDPSLEDVFVSVLNRPEANTEVRRIIPNPPKTAR
jgi:ABC-2 type transport system ATP-binding protein